MYGGCDFVQFRLLENTGPEVTGFTSSQFEGVPYKEDTDKVRAVIESVLALHPHILKDPAPFVEVETLNDSSVDFRGRPFTEGAHYFDVLYSVPEQIKKALDAADIEIPFPHRKLIIEKES